MNPVFIILLFSILAGQIIKIPVLGNQAPPLLDFTVAILDVLGLILIRFHLKNPPTYLKAGLIFIIIATFSLILSPLILTTQEIIISFLYTVRFSIYILFGWLLYSGAFADLKKNILLLLTYSGVGFATLGLLQIIFFKDLSFLASSGWDPHYFRTVSTFLDPNFAGAYFVLTLLLLVQSPGIKISNAFNLGIVFSIVYLALLTTFSRSSYLMLFVSLVTLAYLTRSYKKALLAIVLTAGLFLVFLSYNREVAAPRNIDREQSAKFRLSTWQQGWQLFQEHPILGVGFNAYRFALKQYALGDEQFLSSRGSASNDSSLLFVASTTGGVGLIVYLGMLLSLLKFGFLKNAILFSGLSGLLIHSIFANSLFYPFILFWIIASLNLDTNPKASSHFPHKKTS